MTGTSTSVGAPEEDERPQEHRAPDEDEQDNPDDSEDEQDNCGGATGTTGVSEYSQTDYSGKFLNVWSVVSCLVDSCPGRAFNRAVEAVATDKQKDMKNGGTKNRAIKLMANVLWSLLGRFFDWSAHRSKSTCMVQAVLTAKC